MNLIPRKLRQARPVERGPYCNSSAELANSIARNVDFCNTKKNIHKSSSRESELTTCERMRRKSKTPFQGLIDLLALLKYELHENTNYTLSFDSKCHLRNVSTACCVKMTSSRSHPLNS